ncbi:hypothetical protein ACHAWF_007408 [Thalassiosira exigua]
MISPLLRTVALVPLVFLLRAAVVRSRDDPSGLPGAGATTTSDPNLAQRRRRRRRLAGDASSSGPLAPEEDEKRHPRTRSLLRDADGDGDGKYVGSLSRDAARKYFNSSSWEDLHNRPTSSPTKRANPRHRLAPRISKCQRENYCACPLEWSCYRRGWPQCCLDRLYGADECPAAKPACDRTADEGDAVWIGSSDVSDEDVIRAMAAE